ncbi:hypothetical protein [Hyphomonas sp.]|uniref:hypothetical protein n=1 Tax=Alphaproteobacteria TaxID=28211 RepID=UPI0032672F52
MPVFFGLGGWCFLAPHVVETLSLKPEYQHLSATTALLMGFFGAQTVLCGSLMLLARFTAAIFLGFGLLASIPFFVFNAWFVWVAEMFTICFSISPEKPTSSSSAYSAGD